MVEKIRIVLNMWHDHFANEEHQYSEFEESDIEYFVACLLYNHFAFSKALDTMKTIDLSYDFIAECGNEYDEVMMIIKGINYDDELEALEVLQNFISESKKKYTADESYLLNRLQYHVDSMADRYNQNVEVKPVEFKNPLDR